MQHTPIPSIVVPENRTRREFPESAIEELAESIYRWGLFNPVVVHYDGTLSSGERRLRACTLLAECGLTFRHNGAEVPHGHIPTSLLDELDPIGRLEAEIDENLRRLDLTWQERVAAQARLHQLRQTIHGAHVPGISGLSASIPGWSITNSAAELLGRPAKKNEVAALSRDLHLAEFLSDPMVAAAKNESEALKVVKELTKAKTRATRATEWKQTPTSHRLLNADARTADLPLSSFDCLILDPPYGRNLHKEKFDSLQHEYDDSDAAFEELLAWLPARAFSLAKPASHAYVFCDILNFTRLFVAFDLAGFVCHPRPLIWSKGTVGTFGDSDYSPRHCYDAILYLRKGDRKVTAMYRDVIDASEVSYTSGGRLHPAEKPVDLYLNLARRTCLPGDQILDLFCGSGTIFPTAQQLHLTATGVELSEKYYHISLERLNSLTTTAKPAAAKGEKK
jgi:site-specific DNA-methyltransferase (adenine-specific)